MNIASRLLRPAWFEIDLDAPADNLRSVRRMVGPARKIFAVLKERVVVSIRTRLGRTTESCIAPSRS